MFHVKHSEGAVALSIESAIPPHTATPEVSPPRALQFISLLRMFHVKHAKTEADLSVSQTLCAEPS